MPTKYLDLTDLREESPEVTLSFQKDGVEVERKMLIKDPSVSTMLVAEKLQQDVEKSQKTKDIDSMRKSLQEQVYELLRIDNEVTLEEIETLPFAVLIKLSNWVSDHIKGVFLEGSPKRSTSVSSESKTDEKESKSESTTPSSVSAS